MRSLLVVALALIGTARAEDPRAAADRLIREGKTLGESGRTEEAIEKFREAQALFAHPGLDCNIGLAYAHLKRWPLAHLRLDRCRATMTNPPPWAEPRLREAEKALRAGRFAPVDIVVEPAGARVIAAAFGESEPIRAPQVVWLPLGAQEISASHDGFSPEKRTLQLETNQPISLHLVLRPVEKIPEVVETPPVEAPVIVEKPAEPIVFNQVVNKPRVERRANRRLLIPGLVLLGVGVALGAGGLAANLVAADTSSRVPTSMNDTESTRLIADFEAQRAAAISLYATGAAAGVVGIALAVSGRPRDVVIAP